VRAVTDAEIDYLYNIFLSIDRDGSGEIDVGEFYGHFDLDRTPYSDRMFETMGRLATVLLVLTAIANV
jgi:Ca2+-binding EF-hand superfamily protein